MQPKAHPETQEVNIQQKALTLQPIFVPTPTCMLLFIGAYK